MYLPLISSVMLSDWPRWFAIPIIYTFTRASKCIPHALISPTSQRTINSIELIYRRWWLISGRIEICWNGNRTRSPLFLPVPFCHKSKSYDKQRYTFIIANGSRNSSYRRITSRHHAGSYSVSNSGIVAEAAVHPLDKQILVQRLPCAQPNFKASFTRRQVKYDVRSILRLTSRWKNAF